MESRQTFPLSIVMQQISINPLAEFQVNELTSWQVNK